MAEYSTAQMEESLTEEVVVPEAAPKSWRRFGLVAAALGTVGAIFGMTRPQSLTPVQQMQQMAHAGHSFMQAVVARALDETAEVLSVDMGMAFAPKDMGMDDWSGVSVEAHLRPAEEEGARPFVRVTFQAQEGKGEQLEDQFQNVLKEAKRFMVRKHEVPKELFDMVDVSKDSEDDDKVHITVYPEMDPPPSPEDMAEKPSMDLFIKTGRDFQEIVDNIHGCELTLPGGFQISASTKLAKALIDTVDEYDGCEEGRTCMHPLAAFDQLSSNTELKYDSAALEAATCDADEVQDRFKDVKRFKRDAKRQVPRQIGSKTVRQARKLKDFADHLHSVHIGGVFPGDYEIYIEFENFKLTPVIAEFLQR